MKYVRLKAAFLIVCLFIGSAGTSSAAQERFSLVIREGFGSLRVGDLNTTLESYNSNPALEATRLYYPDRCLGEFRPLNNKFTVWEAEIQAFVWGGFSVGFSVSEKIHLNGQSFLLFTIIDLAGTQTRSESMISDIHVSPPIKLNLYYSHGIFAGFKLYVNGGIGFNSVRMTQDWLWHERFPSSAIEVVENSWDVSGKRRGYHYGFGLECQMAKRMSLLAEGQWRSAKIDTLKGSMIIEGRDYDAAGTLISSHTITEDGILFHYFGEDHNYGGGHEKLLVSEAIWQVGDDSPFGIRQAILDLRGFTFKIGLRIRLF